MEYFHHICSGAVVVPFTTIAYAWIGFAIGGSLAADLSGLRFQKNWVCRPKLKSSVAKYGQYLFVVVLHV